MWVILRMLLVSAIIALSPACDPKSAPTAPGADRGTEETAFLKEAAITAIYARLPIVKEALCRLDHFMYHENPFFWNPDKVLSAHDRPLLLLGEENGQVVGLTTRCSIDFAFPNYSFNYEGKDRPQACAGAIRVTPLGKPDQSVHAFLKSETDRSLDMVKEPSGRFRDEFAANLLNTIHYDVGLELDRDTGCELLVLQRLGRNLEIAEEAKRSKKEFHPFRDVRQGALVHTASGAAAKAGVQAHDVIVAVGDTPVKGRRDAWRAIDWASTKGEVLKLTLERLNGYKVEKIKVVFESSGSRSVDVPETMETWWDLAHETTDTVTFGRNDLALIIFPANITSLDGRRWSPITLGIPKPSQTVRAFLETNRTLERLLGMKFWLYCEGCDQAVQRAKVEPGGFGVTDLIQIGLRILAFATTEPLLWKAADLLDSLAKVNEIASKASELFGDFEKFEKGLAQFPKETVLDITSAIKEVLEEATIRIDGPSVGVLARGRRTILRLAHCRAAKEIDGVFAGSKKVLEEILTGARSRSASIVAVCEPARADEEEHLCYIFISDSPIPLNLSLVLQGQVTAYDNGVPTSLPHSMFLRAEFLARTVKRGVWATGN